MISIILPVKDRAENTKRLLDELSRQNEHFGDQVIIIENGSSEDMSFLDDYDIRLIHEEQVGVGHARNVGLDNAEGDYICWVDNDDYIADDYLATIHEAIKTGLDWYAWDWCLDYKPIHMRMDVSRPLKYNWALWGYCFRRDLFDGVRFDESKVAGSDLKIFEIITDKTSGAYIEKCLYFFKWEGNENSLSHLFNSGKIK